MSDGQDAGTGNVQPQPIPPTEAVAGVSAKEIEDGKAFAILSYVLSLLSLPFFIVPLVMRNNAYALYHAKQCLLLWIAGLAGGVVCGVLMAVCIGFFLVPVLAIALLVLCIMGLINATKGEMKPLPLIGKYAEDWFKGINKV